VIGKSQVKLEAPVPGNLDLVRLPALMEVGLGHAHITVALLDGPVALNHADLAAAAVRTLPGKATGVAASRTAAHVPTGHS
jgi:hypothetical protein